MGSRFAPNSHQAAARCCRNKVKPIHGVSIWAAEPNNVSRVSGDIQPTVNFWRQSNKNGRAGTLIGLFRCRGEASISRQKSGFNLFSTVLAVSSPQPSWSPWPIAMAGRRLTFPDPELNLNIGPNRRFRYLPVSRGPSVATPPARKVRP